MAVLAPPVQVVASGAPPFVAVAGGAPPFVAVSGNAPPITLVADGAPPITLFNDDGSLWAGGAAAAGGAALLVGETDGFATDFLWPVNTERVAVKVAGVVTSTNVNGFYTNAGTSPKQVYDINGTLVWSPHNYAPRSEDLTAGWTLTNLTAASATQIRPTATASSFHRLGMSLSVVGDTYTHQWIVSYPPGSTYKKFGVVVGGTGLSGVGVAFDIETGTVIYSDAVGWTCTIAPGPAAGQFTITGVAPGMNSTCFTAYILNPAYVSGSVTAVWTATDTATGINVHRQQLNKGAVPTAYLQTTGAARMGLAIDHDPVTHAMKGLLCEPAGTNLQVQSSSFDNASWPKLNLTVSANATTAPDGSLTADNLIPNAGSAPHTIYGTSTVVSGTAYTFSVYIKPIAAQRYIHLIWGGATGLKWVSVVFDMQTLTLTQQVKGSDGGNVYTGSSIISLGDGWLRASITAAVADTTGSGSIEPVTTGTPAHGSFGNVTWNANGTDGVAAWGAQVEIGTYGVATSPIPTFAASATRAADGYGFASSSINPSVTAGSWWIDVNNYFFGNGQMLVKHTSASYPIGMPSGAAVSLTDGTSLSKAWTEVGAHKVSAAYQAGDRALTYDGTAVVTDTGATSNLLAPGATISIGVVSYLGHIRKLRYVPRRKTDAELVTETT